jgi:hypothetical protein
MELLFYVALFFGWPAYVIYQDTIGDPVPDMREMDKDRSYNNKVFIREHRRRHERKVRSAQRLGGELSQPNMADGYVYVFCASLIKNPESGRNYNGPALKIGHTLVHPVLRAGNLSRNKEYQDRIFQPLFWFKVKGCFEVEQKCHALLRRKWLWRELYKLTETEAEETIRKAIDLVADTELYEFSRI